MQPHRQRWCNDLLLRLGADGAREGGAGSRREACGGRGLVGGGPPVPEPGSEVVAARHEARVGGRVHDAAHDVVVAQRQQVAALGRPRVPAAQADGPLVRQQHVVLRVVEDGLRPVHLPAAQARACAETRGYPGRRPLPETLPRSTPRPPGLLRFCD